MLRELRWTRWTKERFGGIRKEETHAQNLDGHFRNLNWRYLPYIRPIENLVFEETRMCFYAP